MCSLFVFRRPDLSFCRRIFQIWEYCHFVREKMRHIFYLPSYTSKYSDQASHWFSLEKSYMLLQITDLRIILRTTYVRHMAFIFYFERYKQKRGKPKRWPVWQAFPIKVVARTKKIEVGEGAGRSFLFIPPLSSLFFALVPTFSTNSGGNPCNLGYPKHKP